MTQSTKINSATSKGEQWVKQVMERVNSEEKLRHIYYDGLVYSIAGPSNKTARQEAVLYLTGKKEPVSKCGVNMLKDLLTNHIRKETGIDPYIR